MRSAAADMANDRADRQTDRRIGNAGHTQDSQDDTVHSGSVRMEEAAKIFLLYTSGICDIK